MGELNDKEQEFTGKLMQRGYEKAAASMATLIAQHVEIKKSHVELSKEPKKALEVLESSENHTVMVTELMGDIKGESYLVFNANERKIICELCGKVLSSSFDMPEEAILQEIDNIVSASMITEFSNVLNVSMYGNVPKLLLNGSLSESHYAKDGDSYYILAEGTFVLEHHIEIRPKFIWRLEKELIGHIGKVS